jgi:PAS domain S-box-containing protein
MKPLPHHDAPEIAYKTLFETAPVGVLLYSKRGEVLGANRFLLDLLGSPSLEEAKKINLFTSQNLKLRGIPQVLEEALGTGKPCTCETSYTSTWGKTVQVEVLVFPLGEDSPPHEKGMLVIQDVTRLRQTEELLGRSEQRLRTLAEKIPLGIAVVDSLDRFIFVNPTFVTMFGYSSDETPTLMTWMTRTLSESSLGGKIHRAFVDEEARLRLPGAGDRHFPVLCRDGSSKDVRFSTFSLSEDEHVLVCEDLTELVRAWHRQGDSEEKYRDLLENLTDFVYTIDEDGYLLNINRAAVRSFGYEAEELIGQSMEGMVVPEARSRVSEHLKKVREQGFEEGLVKFLARDGSVRYLEYRSTMIRRPRKASYVVGVARNVTDRVLMKKALKESEAKFQLLVENAHDGITEIDEHGIIRFTNPRMKAILGDPNPEGKSLKEYYDDDNRRVLDKMMLLRKGGGSSTYFITLKDLDGNPHDVVVSGTPRFDGQDNFKGAMGIFTDITQLKKLEAQLQQSQKMEAIGTLAGGIAHDFNNILSGVLGYASLIKRQSPPESQLRHYAEMVEKSAERGAALAGQLLAFSRKSKRFPENVDVHQILDDVTEILQHTLDRNIRVLASKKARNAVIEGDPGQIQQMLMNLCVNAKDAISGGGRILMCTNVVELDEFFCRSRGELVPGNYLEITVEDTGEGMSESVKQRIFEPFFTTKEEGKGTGLGLSMVYGAVTSHGGLIEVESEVGQGTLFRVLLPSKELSGSPPTESLPSPMSRESGTVLVVDDEEIIRVLLAEMLREMGLHVLSAADGIVGLEIYRERWRKIDLVILDMIMPKLSGKDTFLAMKNINPSVRAILSTGSSRESVSREQWEEGFIGFVQKPYRIDELAQVVTCALTRSD